MTPTDFPQNTIITQDIFLSITNTPELLSYYHKCQKIVSKSHITKIAVLSMLGEVGRLKRRSNNFHVNKWGISKNTVSRPDLNGTTHTNMTCKIRQQTAPHAGLSTCNCTYFPWTCTCAPTLRAPARIENAQTHKAPSFTSTDWNLSVTPPSNHCLYKRLPLREATGPDQCLVFWVCPKGPGPGDPTPSPWSLLCVSASC